MVYVVWGGSIRTCGLRGNGDGERGGLELPESGGGAAVLATGTGEIEPAQRAQQPPQREEAVYPGDEQLDAEETGISLGKRTQILSLSWPSVSARTLLLG
jgi:hypothetical protein